MARLTRVNQKVFASQATNNGVFGSLQAGNPQTSNDVATLQSLPAFLTGWDDAIEQGDKLPPLEEFQGIQYAISYQQAYMLQEGIAEWNTDTTYFKGSFCKTISGTAFKLYCSLTDNNQGNVTTNTTHWKQVMDSDDLYTLQSTTTALQSTVNSLIPTLLSTLYPIGSIYIGTQSTCPLATLMSGTTWTKIEGRYLLASGTLTGTAESYSATDTVTSGLPNIIGAFNGVATNSVGSGSASGALSLSNSRSGYGHYSTSANQGIYDLSLNANSSNGTYGQSNAVRSPAYVVNVWRRTA